MLYGNKFRFPEKIDDRIFPTVDPNVTVVSFIGKTNLVNQLPTKISCINDYFKHPIFHSSKIDEESSIEGYFCSKKKVLFLYSSNIYDTNTLLMLDKHDDTLFEKGFLHYFSNLRDTSTRHLLFLFLVSHICVVTNASSSFDLNYIQLFKTLDSVRTKLQGSVAEVLKTVPGLPKDWLTLGRLCSPRVLFYFEQRPPVLDENLKSLQHLMEDQIYRLLRKCRVITNVCTNSLFAIPSNQEFVFFKPRQQDRFTFLLELLNDTFEIGNESPNDFREFLSQHITLAQTEGFSDNVGRHVGPSIFVLPPARVWFDAAFKLFDFFTNSSANGLKGFQLLHSILDVEGQFSEARCLKVLPLALAAYQENLHSHYSSQYHENKKTQAKALLSSHGRGPAVQKFLGRLDTECDRFWRNGRRMCEFPSIIGNPCIQPVHRVHAEENGDSKLPVLPHMSGVRYVSACSCGRRQANREDPYDVEYANYGFYRLIEEECCGRLRRVTFPIFKPSSDHFEPANLKGASKSMHFARDVEKLITGTEDLSLGPDENEFPALSVDHLSQVAADDHEESQTSLGKGEATEAIDEDNIMEIAGTHELPAVSTRDFSTTEYLPCMLHVNSPTGILPRYSSWSLVCLGSSSLYSHNAGLSDQPGFLAGSGFLLPWDIPVRLQHNESNGLESRRAHNLGYSGKGKRIKQGQHEFTVKIFIGVEYECPRGHRFMSSSPGRVLKATGAGLVKDSAQLITQNDVPLYLPCPCPYNRGGKALIAQLMRLHVVTPKAAVHVTVDPKVRPAPPPCPEFVTGFTEPIQLSPSSYWILRFPYVYEDENQIYTHPKENARAAQHGYLLKGTCGVMELVNE
ncbi:nonsense-mediated mRNA decay factor SMG8-like [Daphnia carinata]|uniref:nonsense-mediated mRNA decay factor SMG8-like n=1 Tax=Daphnia carinata TaxID=120202 RepID=UPI00257B26C0|nr:nonsense-mediated mRNA decay factor SMG8-like [Daphnia carinata]